MSAVFPDYARRSFIALFDALGGEFFCHYRGGGARITQFVALVEWQNGSFDEILRRVANDEIRYISWMNIQNGEIFAPYDGGADLFLSSTARRDELREQFKDWLSNHPEGF